jgi:hypothetical protein
VVRVRGSESIIMIAQTGMVHCARRFWLETSAVTEKMVFALIIRAMH